MVLKHCKIMKGDSILSKYENDGNTVRNNGKDNMIKISWHNILSNFLQQT